MHLIYRLEALKPLSVLPLSLPHPAVSSPLLLLCPKNASSAFFKFPSPDLLLPPTYTDHQEQASYLIFHDTLVKNQAVSYSSCDQVELAHLGYEYISLLDSSFFPQLHSLETHYSCFPRDWDFKISQVTGSLPPKWRTWFDFSSPRLSLCSNQILVFITCRIGIYN